jgi:hypothetical protein
MQNRGSFAQDHASGDGNDFLHDSAAKLDPLPSSIRRDRHV